MDNTKKRGRPRKKDGEVEEEEEIIETKETMVESARCNHRRKKIKCPNC